MNEQTSLVHKNASKGEIWRLFVLSADNFSSLLLSLYTSNVMRRLFFHYLKNLQGRFCIFKKSACPEKSLQSYQQLQPKASFTTRVGMENILMAKMDKGRYRSIGMNFSPSYSDLSFANKNGINTKTLILLN